MRSIACCNGMAVAVVVQFSLSWRLAHTRIKNQPPLLHETEKYIGIVKSNAWVFSPGFAIYEGIVASERRRAVCYEITLNDNGVAWLAGWLPTISRNSIKQQRQRNIYWNVHTLWFCSSVCGSSNSEARRQLGGKWKKKAHRLTVWLTTTKNPSTCWREGSSEIELANRVFFVPSVYPSLSSLQFSSFFSLFAHLSHVTQREELSIKNCIQVVKRNDIFWVLPTYVRAAAAAAWGSETVAESYIKSNFLQEHFSFCRKNLRPKLSAEPEMTQLQKRDIETEEHG